MQTLFNEKKLERYGHFNGPWIEKVLYDFVKDAAEKYPDKEAMMDTWSEPYRRVTYSQLLESAQRCCYAFKAFGLAKEDVVSIQLPNCIEQFYVRIALSKIGAISFPFSESLPEHDASFLLGVTKPKIAIIPGRSFHRINYVEMYETMRSSIPSLQDIFVVGGEPGPGMRRFEELLEPAWMDKFPGNYLDQFKPQVTDIWELIATSGTTARPRISYQTTIQFLIPDGQACVQRSNIKENSVILSLTSAAAGLTGGLFGFEAALIAGCKCCFMPEVNPELALKLIQEEKVTHVGGVPAIISRVLHHSDFTKYDLSSWKVFATAGGPVPLEIARKLITEMGIGICNMYGASEAAAPVMTWWNQPEDTLSGSSGPIIPGFDCRLIDNEGNIVKDGEIGEVCWWGAGAGWFHPQEANADSFDEEGYFHSGDLGMVDGKGCLKIVGRKKDMILRGAQNISPKEVEDVLMQHPKVADVAIVKMPDKLIGEKACAYVVPKKEHALTFEDLTKFCEEKQIAKYKWPERLEVIDKLPLSAGGKVHKKLLEEEIAKKLKEEGRMVRADA